MANQQNENCGTLKILSETLTMGSDATYLLTSLSGTLTSSLDTGVSAGD